MCALFKGITSKHAGDVSCLNCLHSFKTENKLKNMKMYVKIMITVIQKCLKKTKNIKIKPWKKVY